MKRTKATKQIGLRVPEELKDRLENRAEEEGRTLSNLIIKICEEYLRKIDEAKKMLGE